MSTPQKPVRKVKAGKPTRAAIARAVASSTAVETGQPVANIERALRARKGKFQDLTLAH